MKTTYLSKKIYFLFIFALIYFSNETFAEDLEIKLYNISTSLHLANNSADVQASLNIINQSVETVNKITLYISKDVKISAVTFNETTATFKQELNSRIPSLNTIAVILPRAVKKDEIFTITTQYNINLKESSNYAALTPQDTLLLPESFWIPTIHTPLQPHGADTAPYSLNIFSDVPTEIFADGIRKETKESITFNSTLSGQPWFIASPFAKPVSYTFNLNTNTPITISVLTQPGIKKSEEQIKHIQEELTEIIKFYFQLFGYVPTNNFTVVSTPREVTHISPTAIVVGESLFRQSTLDAENIEFLTRGIARAWLGGKLQLRGKGLGIIQDALPSYLTGLYFESRYKEEGAYQYWARRVRTYAPLAAEGKDVILAGQSPLDSNYATSMLNKGALVFRLLEKQIGRASLTAVLRDLVKDANKQATLENFRGLLINTEKNNSTVDKFLKQWWYELSEPDFIIGIPQKNSSGGWTCALRNLGTGDIDVPVIATTESAEILKTVANIPSKGFSSVEFKTSSNLSKVEIDPEKLYPQTKYDYDKNSTQFDNDTRPTQSFSFSLFLEADHLFKQKLYEQAKQKLTTALAQAPDYAACRILLARTLIALGNIKEAQIELSKALKQSPLPMYMLGWSLVLEGDIAFSKKDFETARQAYDKASRINAELDCSLAARKGLIESETILKQINFSNESAKKFIEQFDKAMNIATMAALENIVVKVDLPKFVKGTIVSKPDKWTTQIIRTEMIDDNQISIDVKLDVVSADKKEQKGNGVFTIRHTPTGWMLSRIDLFTIQ